MAVYALFADILDYPGPGIASQVRDCISELVAEHPEASGLITEFQAEQARMSLGQLQEMYTSTFDMRRDCTPHLGYHLFGDDTRRAVFMARLKERMEAHHVVTGRELPDHLSLVLRLLEKQGAADEGRSLVEDCLIPAVSRMAKVLDQDGGSNPYGRVLRALLVLLQKHVGAGAVPVETLRTMTS